MLEQAPKVCTLRRIESAVQRAEQVAFLAGVLEEVGVEASEEGDQLLERRFDRLGALADEVLHAAGDAADLVVGRFERLEHGLGVREELGDPGKEDLLFLLEVLEKLFLHQRQEGFEVVGQVGRLTLSSQAFLNGLAEACDHAVEVGVVVLELLKRVHRSDSGLRVGADREDDA